MTDTLTPAQKAWVTRKARAAAAAAPAKPARKTKTLVERCSFLETPRSELTAGQKAALTRKAHLEARARQVAIKTGVSVETPSIVDTTKVVDLYLDNTQVGCGWRRYVVIDKSDKWVTVFTPETLTTLKLSRVEFDEAARPAKKTKPSVLARLINENITVAERINDQARSYVLPEGGADAAKALQVLGA